ncbi:hypothetical protein G6F57_018689 [Rhizopus arrhizus]|nr:hypothetical protein G6F57_018689 [Rhizopus arrhizus]
MRDLKRRAGVVHAGQLLEFRFGTDQAQERGAAALGVFGFARFDLVRPQGPGVVIGGGLAGGLRLGGGTDADGGQAKCGKGDQAESAQRVKTT